MHKIDGPGSVNGHWDPGDPASGRLPTQVTWEYMEDNQENLHEVLRYGGITAEKGNANDLRNAIVAIVEQHGGGGGGGGGGPYLLLIGGTMEGFLTLHAPPALTMHAANKGYVDAGIAYVLTQIPSTAGFVLRIGDSMTGPLSLNGDPTENLHAVPLQYLDARLAAVNSKITVTATSAEFSANFTGQQTVSAAHNLGGLPLFFSARWRCVSADGGWSAGDEIPLGLSSNAPGSFGETPLEGAAVAWCNATHFGARTMVGNSGPLQLPSKNTTAMFTPTNNKWKIVCFAGR